MNKLIFTLILGLSLSAQAEVACHDLFSGKFEKAKSDLQPIGIELVQLKSEMLNSKDQVRAAILRSEFNKKMSELRIHLSEAEITQLMRSVEIKKSIEKESKNVSRIQNTKGLARLSLEPALIHNALVGIKDYEYVNISPGLDHAIFIKKGNSLEYILLDLKTGAKKKISFDTSYQESGFHVDLSKGFSKTGKYFFISGYNIGLHIFDLNGKTVYKRKPPSEKNFWYVRFNKDDTQFAIWSSVINTANANVHIVDIQSSKKTIVKIKQRVDELEIIPDTGNILVTTNQAKTDLTSNAPPPPIEMIGLISVYNRKSKILASNKIKYISSLHLSPDNRLFVSRLNKGTGMDTPIFRAYELNPNTLKKKKVYSLPLERLGELVGVSPDGKVMALDVSDAYGKYIQFYSTELKTVVSGTQVEYRKFLFVDNNTFFIIPHTRTKSQDYKFQTWGWKDE